MSQLRVDPTPRDKSVLWNYAEHRASDVFHNGSNATLKARRGDQAFWKIPVVKKVPADIMCHIQVAGFKGIFDCGHIVCDRGLVTALVERWRPETSTFHLPFGEVTITLEDIQVLCGLNVHGTVVTGKEKTHRGKEGWIAKCKKWLGFEPRGDDLTSSGARIKMTALLEEIQHRPQAVVEEGGDEAAYAVAYELACIRKARCYILYVLGSILCPDKSGSHIQLYMYKNIRNLEECGKLSWGSAVLAYLYKNLCKASKTGCKDITGDMSLLMMWAWERFPELAPKVVTKYTFDKAYGGRWKGERNFKDTTAHYLHSLRDVFYYSTEKSFHWMPYGHVLDKLPYYCTSELLLCRCETFIIFWDIVEPYLASRVKRQFGLQQDIPPAIPITRKDHKYIHDLNRTGYQDTDWEEKHKSYILLWNTRDTNLVEGPVANVPEDVAVDYYRWYRSITVVHIVQPGQNDPHVLHTHGGGYEILMEGHSRFAAGLIDHNQQRSMAGRYMSGVGATQRLEDISVRYTEQEIEEPLPVVERISNRRRTRSNVQRQNQVDLNLNIGGTGTSNVQAEAGPSNYMANDSSSWLNQLQFPSPNLFTPPNNQTAYHPTSCEETYNPGWAPAPNRDNSENRQNFFSLQSQPAIHMDLGSIPIFSPGLDYFTGTMSQTDQGPSNEQDPYPYRRGN